jgi:transcriptional regulator with XRE-family HTH domain
MSFRTPHPLRNRGGRNAEGGGHTLDRQAAAESLIEDGIARHSDVLALLSLDGKRDSDGSSMNYLSAETAVCDNNPVMEIGDRIRVERRKAGLTQVQLAERLGVDKSAVAQWESPNSRKGITLTNLLRVADVLAIKLSKLTGDHQDDGLFVKDDQEIALLKLFRQMPARYQRIHLELFYASAGLAKPEKLQSDPTHGKRVVG